MSSDVDMKYLMHMFEAYTNLKKKKIKNEEKMVLW